MNNNSNAQDNSDAKTTSEDLYLREILAKSAEKLEQYAAKAGARIVSSKVRG